jgi:hypothetical protein
MSAELGLHLIWQRLRGSRTDSNAPEEVLGEAVGLKVGLEVGLEVGLKVD